jgi:trimethylamine---corrinoid protein Co-methyltransferase
VLPALAGANVIYGLGMLESGVTLDYAQLVMDAEFARMVKHVVAGIPVNDETLAVDDIHAVGSFGDFLSLDATLRHMREQSQPRLIDRRVREDWASMGGTDLYARARERARDIVKEHRPEPLDADVAAQMRRVVERADREAGVG